ncbi:MAG: hypothetical protein HY506_00630 [Candidatus Yanofskybacteria bacterium]|nr:hypothetical protein [Candidatus Yanofskybacteria bacterium]
MKSINSKYVLSALSILIPVSVLAILIWSEKDSGAEAEGLDRFAQCLAQSGAVMYGADWCPHCQNEKNAFGDAWKFISYVECPSDPKKCLDLGIKGYPTWIWPDSLAGSGQAGRRFEGEQGIEKLSLESGCQLPERK